MRVLIFVGLLLISIGLVYASDCPNGEDYSPCECRVGGLIACDKIPLAEVQQIFLRNTPADIDTFELTPLASEASIIPADLLASHRVTDKIQLDCPFQIGGRYKLQVDRNAFATSRNTTLKVFIGYRTGNCDAIQLDFSFLTGFEQLTEIYISDSTNIEQASKWADFPLLPKLTSLTIAFCTGLDNWAVFPVLENGLSLLSVPINGLHDETVGRILDWALQSSSQTLKTLSLDNNALTTIPKQIPLFIRLTELHLNYQQTPPGLSRIETGSLIFGSEPVNYLFLDVAGVRTIEPNAFQGALTYF